MKIARPPAVLAALLMVLTVTGCSTYDTRYAFEPRPAEVTLHAPGGAAAAQTLATVVGVRRAVPSEGIDAAVEVRLRIDSVSNRSLRFDPGSLSLLSADLQQFPRPKVDPPGIVQVGPGAPAELVASFPIPNDASRPPMDLSGLSLRWSVEVDGTTVPGNITFNRRRYSRPPHWNYGWSFGYYGHRRHSSFGFYARCP